MSEYQPSITPSGTSHADPQVSIIMPVYNSEEYVEEAIRSLLDQDFDSFEVIAVDDGSTDASGEICDRIAAADERLRVIHKPNAGLCAARNTGITEARGAYLMFCDNDDVVYPGFIADNYRLIEKYDADMVRFGRILVKIDKQGRIVSQSELAPATASVFEGEAVCSNIDALLSTSQTVWTAIYRKSLIEKKGILFDEELHSGGEDHIFNDLVYGCANKVVTNPRSYYEWRRRAIHSTSMGFNENLLDAFMKSLALEDELMRKADILQKNPAVYADVMTFPLMDTITAGVYARKGDCSQEKRIYQMLYELYLPYFSRLRALALKPSVSIALRLLESQKYRMLYWYTRIGVCLKKRLRQLRSVKNSASQEAT